MQERDPLIGRPQSLRSRGEASDRASHYDSAEDLPQGLRSDHTEDEVPVARNPEDEVPSARNPIPETEVGEARPARNENGPGPSTASNRRTGKSTRIGSNSTADSPAE